MSHHFHYKQAFLTSLVVNYILITIKIEFEIILIFIKNTRTSSELVISIAELILNTSLILGYRGQLKNDKNIYVFEWNDVINSFENDENLPLYCDSIKILLKLNNLFLLGILSVT